ncbi:unnamed protein product [Diamesa serratosioi]
MSTYRNYRPWNTSASSSNYSSRSDFRSRYSTRDDGSSTSSLSSKTPQFSSITPSTYRPSYSSSSGTYRASRSTSTVTPTSSSSLTTPYVSRYSSLTRDKDKDNEKEKEKDKKELSPPKKLTSRYLGSATSKDLSAETKSKLLSAGYGTPKKEEKGPPITFNTRYKVSSSSTSRGRSRDPSPSVETSSAPPQTALQRLTAARDRSRDPSPATKSSSYTSRITSTREKSRDPSPSAGSRVSALTRLSTREPSPSTRSYTNRDKPSETSTLGRSYSNIGSSRDKPVESGSSTLGRSYSNSAGLSRDKSVDSGSSGLGRSYSTSSRDKPNESTSTLGRYSSNISIKDRASRDPSPAVATRRSSITAISSYPRSRDPSPAENRLSSYRLATSSRDPSPVDTKRYSLNKPLSVREPSPLNTASYRRTSRESSPSEKFVAGSGFAGATYNKMYPKAAPGSPNTPTKTDISISYMTTVETRARPSRVRSIPSRISPQKEAPKSPTPPKIPPLPVSLVVSPPPPPPPVKDDTSSSEEEDSSEETESSEEEVKKPETKIMIQVTTITRATSPTPPGSTPSRSRRMEVAKTIEKVRQRPLQGPPMIDQMTQSDRMDDSTRYSRFGSTSRISTTSSYTPSPTSYSRYTSRYTPGTTSVTEPAEDKSESSEKSEKSDKFNFALPKSKETSPVKSIPVSTRVSSVKSLSPLKMVSPRDKLRTPSKSQSKTPDSGKSLPPQSPKAESPSRSPAAKIANKDFRKSALNMGPTDRIRTSKSSSSENSSPTIEKTRMQFQKLEKSPSCLSERESSVASDDSNSSSTETESQMEQTISVAPPPAVIIVDKDDLISTKVESAKNYLLKTLGNPSFAIRKSPSPALTEDSSWCDKTEYLHLSPTPVVNKCVSPSNDDTVSWKSDGSTSNYPTQTSSTKPGFKFSLKHQDSGERPWWLENDDATEDENTQDTEQDVSVLENDVTLTADDQTHAIHEDCKITNGIADISLNGQTPEPNSAELPWWKQGPINYLSEKLNSIQRVESGEKAWWFNSDSSGKKSTTPTKALMKDALNLKWEQETQADVSELQKDDDISGIDYGTISNHAGLPKFPATSDFDKVDPPLGDRASPEGLEDSKLGRSSPYDNIPVNGNGLIFQKERNFNATPKMFISRHTNIDDLLGGSSVFSPTSMERTYCLFQEITPDEVRIHNSNSPPKSVLKRNAENDAQNAINGAVVSAICLLLITLN